MIDKFLKGFSSAIGKVEYDVSHLIKTTEFRLTRMFSRLVKTTLLSIYEGLMYLIAGILLLMALILFLTRFIPLDLSLLIAAVLALYAAFLFRISK